MLKIANAIRQQSTSNFNLVFHSSMRNSNEILMRERKLIEYSWIFSISSRSIRLVSYGDRCSIHNEFSHLIASHHEQQFWVFAFKTNLEYENCFPSFDNQNNKSRDDIQHPKQTGFYKIKIEAATVETESLQSVTENR